MATTTTPKLGLKKNDDGDYGWGQNLRDNMDMLDATVGQLVDERAVSGTATGGSATSLTDSSLSMGTDAFAGGVIVVRRSSLLRIEQIISNTADTFNFASGTAVQAGDTYIVSSQANALPLSGGQLTGLLRNNVVSSIASASTIDLSSTGANAGMVTAITGTASVSTVTMQAGEIVEALAAGAIKLVNGANLVVESGVDYTCAVGDRLTLISFDGTKTYVFIKPVNRGPQEYDSGEQTITTGGSLSLAHGLGAEPFHIVLTLICKTAEGNYLAGNKIRISPWGQDTSIRQAGISVIADATTIDIRYGSAVAWLQYIDRTTGATFDLTPANWRLIVRARL